MFSGDGVLVGRVASQDSLPGHKKVGEHKCLSMGSLTKLLECNQGLHSDGQV